MKVKVMKFILPLLLAFLIAPLLLVSIVAYGLFEAQWLETKKVEFRSPDIPPSFEGIKIAFLTDIHCDRRFSGKKLAQFVRRVNDLKADLILTGGDYVSGRKYAIGCFQELKNLKAPMGVFGVLGGHDHWAGVEFVKKEMEKAGITLLDNYSLWIKKGTGRIKLGGVGDLWEDKQDLNPTLQSAQDKDFVVLVSHNPDYVEKIKRHGLDLVLCGHTHGGQVTLFGLWAPFIPSAYGIKYRSGCVRTDCGTVYISNGVGTVGYPFRLFARPQILLITLRRSSSE
ncbi:MAG: metallophosphoesterase [bacterium]